MSALKKSDTMKNFPAVFAALLAVCSIFAPAVSRADVIATNPITGTNPNTSNPYTTGQTVAPNLTFSGIGRGSGISGTNANDRYNATGWNTPALDANDYFTFTLTPATGYVLDLTSFAYVGQASGSGPTSFAFRSSLDGFSANIGSPTAAGTTISLTDAAFQGLSGPIEFRLYGWDASAAGGTYSINDFTFNGTIQAAAATYWTGTGAGATWANGQSGHFSGNYVNDLANTVTFAGAAEEVTVSGTVQAGNLAYETAGYSTTGGTIELGQGAISTVAGTTTIASTITGSAGVTKAGAGALVLSGSNTYTGATTVSAGVVNIRNAGALGATGGGNRTTVASGAALEIEGGISTAESLTVGGSGVSGGGAIRNVSGSNTITSTVTVSADTRIQSDAGTLTFDTASGNAIEGVDADLTFGGNGDIVVADSIAIGVGSVAKDGAGTLALGASNTFSGGTTISGGTVIAGATGALGTGGVTMNAGSLFGADGVTISNAITIGTAASTTSGVLAGWDFNGVTGYGASPLAPSTETANVEVGGLTRGSGVTTSGTAASNAWGGADWSSSNNSATAIADGDYVTFTIQATEGLLSLSSIDSYNVRRSGTGPATGLWQYSVNEGAFVDIGSAITWGSTTTAAGNAQSAINLSDISALQNLAAGTTVTFRIVNYEATTGTWYLNNFQTGNDFSISGEIPVAASGSGSLGIDRAGTATFTGQVTVNNMATLHAAADGTAVFENAIVGDGIVTKTGEGIVVFTEANSYEGGTVVSDGTLRLEDAGTLGSGAVVVQVDGVMDIASLGTLVLGEGADFTLDGTLALGLGVAFDSIHGNGAFLIASGAVFLLDVEELEVGTYEYAVLSGFNIEGNGDLAFSFVNGSLAPSKYSATLGSDGVLTITAVPEPHEYAIAMAGLLLVVMMRKRRRI